MAIVVLLTTSVFFQACSKSAHNRGQKRTIAEIRNYGTLWMENVDKWQKIPTPTDAVRIRKIEAAEATRLVSSVDFPTIPDDGWDKPLEIWFMELGAKRQLMLRSAGGVEELSEGIPAPRLEDFQEKPGAFPRDEPSHLIVWVDGEFMSWPM